MAVLRFTDPDWLRTIEPSRLSKLLLPWAKYLTERGCSTEVSGTIDCGRLSSLLAMGPDAAVPTELIQTINYIYETSSIEDMEELVDLARALELEINEDAQVTAADLAIDIWVIRPSLIEDHHAESLARRHRNFEYFGGKTQKAQKFPEISSEQQSSIEHQLNAWFENHRRGGGCRVFVFRRSPSVWLLVRHGMPVKREASHREDGDTGTELFRPQQHDVLFYDERTDEIGVYASTKGERALYLKTLGRVLFADEGYFPASPKFTLAPLLEVGAEALRCDDIEGVESIRLTEWRTYWGGKFKEQEVHRATDIFAALSGRAAKGLPKEPNGAIFKIKFSDAKKPRSVTIRTPASARYERPADCDLVEQWLRARGFLLRLQPEEGDEEPTEVLEIT